MKDTSIAIRRVVPNLYVDDLEANKEFYLKFLGLELAMDLGWILTFVSKENPLAQLNLFKNEGEKKPDNSSVFLSVEVSDVDQMYERAKDMDCEIIYDLTDESWGVRRFFVLDPNGATINLLSHRK